MDEEENLQPIVIDVGSFYTKCGYSGDDKVRVVFPTITGVPRHTFMGVGMDAKDFFVGDEAQAKRGILKLSRPIPCDGTPINFRYLEKMLFHTVYNELRVTPEEHPLLMTTLPNLDENGFEKMLELVFESLYSYSLYVMDASVMSLENTGRATGCVLESGGGTTYCSPISEGYPVPNAKLELEDQQAPVGRKKVGGDLVTDALIDLLSQSERYVAKRLAEKDFVDTLKKKHCYVLPNPLNEIRSFHSLKEDEERILQGEKAKDYTLPDGETKITVGCELCSAPEILFKPYLFNSWSKIPGVHDLIYLSIQKCKDMELEELMYKNIVTSGGGTWFPGYNERLTRELQLIKPSHIHRDNVKVHYASKSVNIDTDKSDRDSYYNLTSNYKTAAWCGGSKIADLSSFSSKWVMKDEYEEKGWNQVLKKFKQMTLKRDQTGEFAAVLKRDIDRKERIEYVRNHFFVDEEQRPNEGNILVDVGKKVQICVSKFLFL